MFQSTLPTRGSDAERHEYGRDAVRFQSTLPTRGSDAWCACPCRPDTTVSIHAPHEGERRYAGQYRPVGQGFNPRSPRGGATPFLCTVRIAAARFQSTLPTRGSDKTRRDDSGRGAKFQSTLPTRGSDVIAVSLRPANSGFQSTLPTRGSDHTDLLRMRRRTCFNPRSPRGGATLFVTTCDIIYRVSIHAPHEGERPSMCQAARKKSLFQSTLPTRGSDAYWVRSAHIDAVSIHAPHEGERRAVAGITACTSSCFNPRSPRGGATS